MPVDRQDFVEHLVLPEIDLDVGDGEGKSFEHGTGGRVLTGKKRPELPLVGARHEESRIALSTIGLAH